MHILYAIDKVGFKQTIYVGNCGKRSPKKTTCTARNRHVLKLSHATPVVVEKPFVFVNENLSQCRHVGRNILVRVFTLKRIYFIYIFFCKVVKTLIV